MAIPLSGIVARLIELREKRDLRMTLLAVCPNSSAVLEAAVKVAARDNVPMLFAATLNQVDRDGGYTGWTPREFVAELDRHRATYECAAPLYPCLDHGGPWLKDAHARAGLSLAETMQEVKLSLTACIEAGYALLHIDPTVDRALAGRGETVPIDLVVERTVELIAHAETERQRLGLDPIAYEVGTEEVAGGLVDHRAFESFVRELRGRLDAAGLAAAWPSFIVAKVGTDLDTTDFDAETARRLDGIVRPLGSLLKGHYTDWVANPEAYPESGMGGANVGPEFTSEEYLALEELVRRERDMLRGRSDREESGLLEALETAVFESGRWQKWLHSGETERSFRDLEPERRSWLVQTGCRYIWQDSRVLSAREHLYENVGLVMRRPHDVVVDRIAASMERYVTHFRLFDAQTTLTH